MHCAACQSPTRVVESRPADDGGAVRRRRECSSCGRRFTTLEKEVPARLFVRKRSGRRQPFDREKLLSALSRAAHKRPVDMPALEALVDEIEGEAAEAGGELDAQRIGEMCLEGLAGLDRGAFLQFAGVFDAAAASPAPVLVGAGSAAPAVRPAEEAAGVVGAQGSVRASGEDPALPRESD